MKKRMKKILGLFCVVGLLAGSLMACGGNSSDGDSAGGDLSGQITLAGSTSMEKVCNALSESFMEAYPNVTVTTEFTGSSAGLESLAAGSVDIGNASRSLTDEEKETGAVENIVAIDGIGVVTDKDNKTETLTTEELTKIYTGEITNWSELGQEDADIVVIGREAGSGTRDAFERLYDDVNSVLSTMARTKDGVWKKDYDRGVRAYDNTLKYTVSEWELPRDTFSGLLTRFWEKNKTSNLSDVKSSVTNFLTTSEGMQKPGFFQSFMSKFADYLNKETVLTNVIKTFLKDGHHRLR